MLAPYFIFCICSSFPHPFSGHFTSASLYLSYKLLAALWWYVFICPLVTWFKYLFLLLYTFFFLHLLVTTNKQFFFLFFFFSSRQSLIHMPIIQAAQGPSAPGTEETSSSLHFHYALDELESLLFFLSSHLSFCLVSTIGLALAGLPHHPPSIHHSHPYFIPLSVFISFLLTVNFLSRFQSF